MKKIKPFACFFFVIMFFLVCADVTHAAAYASLDPAFAVQRGIVGDGNINVSEIQPDGKIFIGGDFEQFEGVTKRSLMRLNNDGLPDSSFDNDFKFSDGEPDVYAIAFQSDGKILVGGRFSIENDAGENIARYLIRLNTNGSLDTSFDAGEAGVVQSLAIQSDGKILVGGTFKSFAGETDKNGLIRLNENGSIDGSFNPSVTSTTAHLSLNIIKSIVVQDDKKILVGGRITIDNEEGERVGLVRFNNDGSLDSSFETGTGLMISGDVDTSYGRGGGGGISEPVPGTAASIKVQFDGKILVGGSFTHYNGIQSLGVVRLNGNGSVDRTYDPGSYNAIKDLEILSDGSIITGGHEVMHLKNDGTRDENFGSFPITGGDITSINVYGGDKILVCGTFLPYKTVKTDSIFRLVYPTEQEGEDVSRGEMFVAQTIGGSWGESGFSVIRTVDNGYLVTGSTNDSFGVSGGYVLKFKRSGSLDRSFCDGGSCILKIGSAASATQLSDGKYVVTGKTTNNKMYVAKLTQSGSYDPSFANNGVQVFGDGTTWNGGNKIIQTSDGGIVILGSLTHDKYAPYLVKLTANGSLDTSFGEGGTRTLEGGTTLVGDMVQSDDNGFVIIGSTRASYEVYNDILVTKFTANGSLDTSFGDGGMRAFGSSDGHEYGYDIAKTSDGGYVLVGRNGNVDMYIIKITANGALDSHFGENGMRTISGSGNEVARTITRASDGGYVIAGQTTSFGAGGNDMYFVKLNEAGDFDVSFGNGGTRTVGTNKHVAGEIAYDITVAADGGYVAIGTASGLGAGGSDIYMVYLDNKGNMPNSCGHQSGSGGTMSTGGSIVSVSGLTTSSYSVISPFEGSWTIGSGAIVNRQCTSQANFVDDEDDDETGSDQGITIPKPDLSFSGRLKNTVLSSRKKIYIKNDKMTFKGNFAEIAGGTVVITYKDGSDDEEEIVAIDQNGNWSQKISFDEDGNYKIKFAFYDKDGKKIGEKGSYKIRIDTEDPEFGSMPSKLTKRVGDKIWWKVSDNEEVDKYKYYFNGKKEKTDDAFFHIPKGTPRGTYTLEIRAYDKAGNKAVKNVTVVVR